MRTYECNISLFSLVISFCPPSPRVAFCGYSIPHPADNKVNIRVQTTGDPAKDVMKDALQDLMVMGQHVRATFDKAVADFKSNIPAEQMDVDANK